jgi:riboflavin kinase/FMN adenylyltransferase
MQLIRNLDAATDAAPTAVAIGNFDGLHRGHAQVIEAMLKLAEANSLIPSVLTFEPHPRRYFAPDAPVFRLEMLKQKLARLREWGVKRVYMPRFNAAFAAQSAEVFLQTVLQQQLNARAIVTGENFAFGAKRGGNAQQLIDWGASHGIAVQTLAAVKIGEIVCSSSAVRTALTQGDTAQVQTLLGRAYRLTGRVMHGDARGRQLGFPTANIALSPGLKLPAYGVYAVRMHLDGEVYPGVANLGVRPTFGGASAPRLEVHLFDFDRDIYGATVAAELLQHLRGEQKFDSLDTLKTQIASDCEAARSVV